MNFNVDDRVDTGKHGPGTVVEFEHLGTRVGTYNNVFSPDCRVGVKLDDPKRWPLYKTVEASQHPWPFYYPKELTKLGD